MRYLILFTAFILPFSFTTPVAADKALSAAEKSQIEKIIANYFIENPEALGAALDNMQNHYQQKEEQRKKQVLRDNAEQLYRSKGDFSIGPDDAPITIVEFFDYNCGYCKRVFQPLMQVLQENEDVRLVFKEMPILNSNSTDAARTALAIDDKMKFLTFHTKLMTHGGNINAALIDRTLKELKLSPADIRKAAMAAEISKTINRTQRLASRLGITGTPAFVINDELRPGALSKDELDSLILRAREKLKNKKG